MSGTQKPFSNEPRKPEPPPAPEKKSGFFGKLFKLVLFLAVVGAVGSMAWHGKKLGEERAVRYKSAADTEEQARAKAKMVFPWEWSTPEWEGWWVTVQSLGRAAGAKMASSKTWIAEKGGDAWKTIRSTGTTPATTGGGTGTTTPPATTGGGGTTTPPPVTAGTPLPPDFDKAVADLKDGEDLWNRNDLKGARPKLENAVKLLEGLRKTHAGDTRVEGAYELATQYLENVNSRDF